MNAGRVIASSITAPQSPSSPVSGVANAKQFIPVFWSAQGGQLRYCGNTMITDGYDGFHLAGKPDDGKFVGYYGKNDEIVALCSMGMDPYMAKAATLMRESRMPTLSDVKGGTDILEISVVG